MQLILVLAMAAAAQPIGTEDKTMYRWSIGGGMGWEFVANGPVWLVELRDTPSAGWVRGLDVEGGIDRFGSRSSWTTSAWATYDRGIVHNGLQGLFIGPRVGFRYARWRDEVTVRTEPVAVSGASEEIHLGGALSARWVFHPGNVVGVEVRGSAVGLGFGSTPARGEVGVRLVVSHAETPFGPPPLPR